MRSSTGLTGAAGELLVAAELLRRGIAVARPLYDDGIDLLAFRTSNPAKTVPIQVKARSGAGYNFQKDWFCVPGIVLVLVWHTAIGPEFYVLREPDVEDALGPVHAASLAGGNTVDTALPSQGRKSCSACSSTATVGNVLRRQCNARAQGDLCFKLNSLDVARTPWPNKGKSGLQQKLCMIQSAQRVPL